MDGIGLVGLDLEFQFHVFPQIRYVLFCNDSLINLQESSTNRTSVISIISYVSKSY